MNLVYYNDTPNFGDALNPYIFGSIFANNLILGDKNIDFYGIGSVIHNRMELERPKIIFGSGVRDYNFSNNIDNWDIFFVRGYLSAKILRLTDDKVITDSALAIRLLDGFEEKYLSNKEYDLSLIPYFRHLNLINWGYIEKLTGIHVIDPTLRVETILEEIDRSRKVICGAMHGAILADALRVPWCRLKLLINGHESSSISEFKWADYLSSIRLKKCPTINIRNYPISNVKGVAIIEKSLLNIELVLKLRRINSSEFYMTSDALQDEQVDRINKKIYQVKSKYGF